MKKVMMLAVAVVGISGLLITEGCSKDKRDIIKESLVMLQQTCKEVNETYWYKAEKSVPGSDQLFAINDSVELAYKKLEKGAKEINSLIQEYDYINGGPAEDSKMHAYYSTNLHAINVFYHFPATLGAEPDYSCKINMDIRAYAVVKGNDI